MCAILSFAMLICNAHDCRINCVVFLRHHVYGGFKQHTMYCVAEFTKANSLELVATSWISQKPDCDELICFWSKSSNITKMAHDFASPDEKCAAINGERCTNQVSCHFMVHYSFMIQFIILCHVKKMRLL